MKKSLCIVLCVLLILPVLALAEGFSAQQTPEEQALTQMLPVVDSLARTLGVGSANQGFSFYRTFDPQDSALVWEQLRRIAVNWLSQDVMYQAGNELRIPAQALGECAKASFAGMAALPALAANSDIRFDTARNAYIIPKAAEEAGFAVIERYAADGEALVINCGLYAADGAFTTGGRLGGMTARLTPLADAQFPYAVAEARPEAAGDFDGLNAKVCDIRRPQTAAATIAPTAKPTAAPTAKPTAKPAANVSYTKLSSGSKGDAVRALQNRLNALGYECGKADGVFGRGTKRAVRYFQDAIGFKQDGVASTRVQEKLFASGAPKFQKYVTLKKGSGGIRVEDLQQRLRELGYTAAPVDGSFGDRTVETVKQFQRAAGLKDDGIAGTKTLKALEKKDAPKCTGFIELVMGDTGDRVTQMQNQLIALKLLEGKPSGKYDDATAKAVKAFSDAVGGGSDGKRASAQLIESMFKPVPTPTPTPTPAPSEKPGDNPGGDNPGGDNPGGDNPGGDNPGGDNPGGDNPGGDNPGGDNPGGDNPGGDNPGGDNPGSNPGGDNPGGDNPGGDNPGGDNPGSNPGGDNPGGSNPSGETPSGETPSSETPSGETPSGETPSGEGTGN